MSFFLSPGDQKELKKPVTQVHVHIESTPIIYISGFEEGGWFTHVTGHNSDFYYNRDHMVNGT